MRVRVKKNREGRKNERTIFAQVSIFYSFYLRKLNRTRRNAKLTIYIYIDTLTTVLPIKLYIKSYW